MTVLAATRRWLCLLLLAAALVAIFGMSTRLRARRCDRLLRANWDAFRLGMSHTDLDRLFGPPTRTWAEGETEFVRWDGSERFLELQRRDGGAVFFSNGQQPSLRHRFDAWSVKRFGRRLAVPW